MNAAMSAENQALMNDNKQLNVLIKEYEQTLENLMATFRTRAVSRFEFAFVRASNDHRSISERSPAKRTGSDT